MLRAYTRVATAGLIALAAVGFVGFGSFDLPENFYHLFVGCLLAYLGFFHREPIVLRRMVGGLGVLLLAVTLVTHPDRHPDGALPCMGPHRGQLPGAGAR